MPIPQQKITVSHIEDSSSLEFQDFTIATDVWLRENKGSNATLTALNNEGTIYLNHIDQDDIIQIHFKNKSTDPSWAQVFGGYVVELAPESDTSRGYRLPTKCYGFDIALDRMRVKTEYGSESVNSDITTVYDALFDSTVGIFPKYVHKVLATATDSGYLFNDGFALDDSTPFLPYSHFPFTPVNDALKQLLDLYTAANNPDPGLHWTVIPDGATSYFCMDVIGDHTTAAVDDMWPTNCPVTLTIGENIRSVTYSKQPKEANYIVYFGKYEYPTNELLTEDAATYWTEYTANNVTITDDTSDKKVGSNSVKFNFGATGAFESIFYFPVANLDITKIGTKRTVPTWNFYIKANNFQWVKLLVGTGDPLTDYSTKALTLPTNNTWGKTEVSLGTYIKEGGEDTWTTAAGTGVDWTDIDYVGFDALRPATGQTDIRFDDMRFRGIVTRAAYHSDSGKYKIKLITDSLAKTTNLVAATDSGTVAQLAKAELLRAMTTPTIGSIMLDNLYPSIKPGQMIPSLGFRITEVHFHIDDKNVFTELAVTDDLLNSYPLENTSFGPTAQYNAIMKAVNPDFQDRDRGDLKARDIDIDQTILAKDYA
jgi:hypothetical protein